MQRNFGDSEISPRSLHCGERGERGGFGTQHARAESKRLESGGFRVFPFARRKPAFGTDEQNDLPGGAFELAQRGRRIG
jgi:hypothetical protein